MTSLRLLTVAATLGLTACGGSSTAPAPVTPSGPLFTMSGRGDNVFTIPSYVRRIKITGTYTGTCQNFIVDIAGRSVVNVIIGTCSVADTRSPFSGTYITTGGLVEITSSTGVTWTFTEVR